MHMYMHKCTSGTTNQSSFLCNNKTGSGSGNNNVCRKQDALFVYLSICSFEFVMPRLGKQCAAMRCNVKLRDAKNQADKRSQKKFTLQGARWAKVAGEHGNSMTAKMMSVAAIGCRLSCCRCHHRHCTAIVVASAIVSTIVGISLPKCSDAAAICI